MKIFISQPMRGKSDEEITVERELAIKTIKNVHPDALIIDSFLNKVEISEKHPGLGYLSRSIKLLDLADEVWFLPGWENARGCKIEHECAEGYGVKIVEFGKM